MRNLLAVALLLSSGCDAGKLRKSDEGFEVVGGSPVHEFEIVDQPDRELFGRHLVEEEVEAVKETIEDDREYVSPPFDVHEKSVLKVSYIC